MRSLERAIDVLEVLEEANAPLKLSEIARRADLHLATAQRIVSVLEHRGRVERDGAEYRTGVAMLFGAHSYLATNRLATSAAPVLQELAAATELTASLFVRSGWSRAVIARVEGTRPLRYQLPIGERLPLHLGAGKVLCAHLSSEKLTAMLDHIGTITAADGSTISQSEFRASMDTIRIQGYATAHSERVLGTSSISAPIINRENECVGAIQVAGSTDDLDGNNVDAMSLEVRQAATAIGKRLT